MEESAFNSSQRRLCPDGSCVGLLDSDGRCRVCGTQGDAGAPAGAASASPPAAEAGDDFVDADADADTDTDTADTDTDDAAAEKSAAAGATGSGFKADRRLCDDGSCVGVIGASGVCSVCGQRAAG